MNSTSNQIVEKLLSKILEQEVINNTLCDILIEAGLVDEVELMNRLNTNMDKLEEKVDDIKEKAKDDFLEMLPYYGEPGQA
jgi:hypothetical protein